MIIQERVTARIDCHPDYREKLETVFEALGIRCAMFTYSDGVKYDRKLKNVVRMHVEFVYYDDQFDVLKERLEEMENKYHPIRMVINPLRREL